MAETIAKAVAEGCALCWLCDRIEIGGGPLEIGLCYAVHIGATVAGGAAVPICERHQMLLDRTGKDFVQAQASEAATKPTVQ